jgi:hypothetical protein
VSTTTTTRASKRRGVGDATVYDDKDRSEAQGCPQGLTKRDSSSVAFSARTATADRLPGKKRSYRTTDQSEVNQGVDDDTVDDKPTAGARKSYRTETGVAINSNNNPA